MSIAPPPPALEMRAICKSYPGVRALKGVTLTVSAGEVHALLGENGAGKSTLIRILAGAEAMDSGEVLLNGRHAAIRSPRQAMAHGIGIIYQEFTLVPSLSVAENILLGREPAGRLRGFVGYRSMYRHAQAVLESMGMAMDVRRPVSSLSVAQQQIVEIAKAVSQDAAIIAMDEPTAALTEREIERLFALVRSLKARGVSVIYISHRLDEVFEIADRATVLRDGERVGVRPVAELNVSEVIRMMVGREVSVESSRGGEPGAVALEVRKLSRRGAIHDVSFCARRGEILGIAGLVGSGRTEIAECIFGVVPADGGEVFVNGRALRARTPAQAAAAGIGFATEDRKALGLVLEMGVRENITLANLGALSRAGFINQARESRVAAQQIADLGIRTPTADQPVRHLSGGNQQKVVLAKWLYRDPQVVIFDEPTRGIDVAAKAEVHALIDRLARQGRAVILISSELPEVLSLSDRILVMHEGRVAGELSRADADQERIMALAMAVDAG